MRISDWSSDVCSSDLPREIQRIGHMAIGRVRRGPPVEIENLARHRLQPPGYGAPDPAQPHYLHPSSCHPPRQRRRHPPRPVPGPPPRSEKLTSELHSLMRITDAFYNLQKPQY